MNLVDGYPQKYMYTILDRFTVAALRHAIDFVAENGSKCTIRFYVRPQTLKHFLRIKMHYFHKYLRIIPLNHPIYMYV